MPKFRNVAPVSEWMAFELDTKIIEPPIVSVRLVPLDDTGFIDLAESGERPRLSAVLIQEALSAIVEWDLELDGAPLPCTDESKKNHHYELKLLLTSWVKGEKPTYLATAIIEYARNLDNFLKN
jgi:hypothetical protein